MRYKYFFFSVLLLGAVACGPKPYKLLEAEPQLLVISDTIPGDTSMAHFLQPYKVHLDSLMDVVIGKTLVTLTKAAPECTMGNLVADAQLEAGKAIDKLVTISVVNYGGIRIPFLAKGNITKGEVYQIMPFDNALTILEVPSDVLQQLCDHMAARKAWPISGFSYKIEDGKAIDIQVMGEAIRPNAVYKMVTSDYVANGGDDCFFLTKLKRFDSPVLLRNALMDKIINDSKKYGGVDPKIENRVSYAD